MIALGEACVADLVEDRANADAEAVVFPGERATYRALAERCRWFARRLHGLGVTAGDHVGLLLPNGIDYLAAFFGIARLGAVIVPINARYKVHELRDLVVRADLRLILTSGESARYVDHPGLLAEAFPDIARSDAAELRLPQASELRQVVLLGDDRRPGMLTPAELDAAGARVSGEEIDGQRSLVRAEHVALILYTSGTTAHPKGCMLTHAGLLAQSRALGCDGLGLTASDRFWTPLPLFHITAIACLVAALGSGATFCHVGVFEPGVALRQLERERCTVAFPSFETIWLDVLDHADFAGTDLGALHTIFSVGVPARLADMQARLPVVPMVTAFGSTESGGFLSLGDRSDTVECRLATGGYPLPGVQIRVVDPDTGYEKQPGEPGEARYRAPQRFVGYYGEPEYTGTVIDEHDWFQSGDVCTLDADGRINFVSRLKDMLKVGGENVAAAEIEDYLAHHPAVQIVQVVSAPDVRYTEVPAAFVQLREGWSVGGAELIEFCRGRIASFKVPRYIRFVEDWPMSGTKIKKVVLRERIASELAEAGVTQAPRMSSR